MHISGLTSSQVWLSSARSLTNFGSSALAAASAQNQTLAAAAAVDLRSSAGIVGNISVGAKTGVASTAGTSLNLWDGTSFFVAVATAAAAGSTAVFSFTNTNPTGPRLLNNDGAVAATYAYAQYLLTI